MTGYNIEAGHFGVIGGYPNDPEMSDGANEETGTYMNFIIRWIVTAVAVGVAVWIVPGIAPIGSNSTLAIAALALVLALINVSLKPLLQVLSLPITVLTLGIFYLIVNALLLELAAWAAGGIFGSGISIDGFGSAFLGSIVISIVSAIVNSIIGTNEQ